MLWSFSLIIMCLLSFSPAANQRFVQSNRHADKHFMKSLTSRRRRTMTREVSCNQSPIQLNMTLKGGIQAGYFRKLAQHVAMQLCIELCCEEKGCDVAFMSGKNCYGVQCFSVELCQAIPAKKRVSEPLMVSHVTIKGEKALPAYTPHENDKLQCSATRMKTNATLRGGLQAGNFTDVGIVENMQMCVKLCCVSEKCHVALMINTNCFLVACFSRALCENVHSLSTDYSPSLSYVLRKHEKITTQAHSLKFLDSTTNQLVCKNSEVFYNTTLKGGYHAGNYTNFGKVANLSECIRLCCGNRNCDVALMLENNCFAVACKDTSSCLPVHAKSSTSLAALNPRLSYITSRSEEVAFREEATSNGVCHAGIISYDVTLRGGAKAGNFTPHGKVGNMETCISKCCHIDGCGVAMMLRDICFTVVCKEERLCEKKPTATSSNFNPKIAYVFRDKRVLFKNPEKSLPSSNTSLSQHYNELLAQRLNEITESYIPTISIASTFSAFMLRSSKSYKQKHRTTLSDQFIRKKLPTLLYAKQLTDGNITTDSKVRHQDQTVDLFNASKHANFTKDLPFAGVFENQLPKPSMHFFNKTSLNQSRNLTTDPGLPIDEPSCRTTDVMYNVTIRGGIKAGKFKDRGQMDNIGQCVRLCCLLTDCDVAFMLSKTCFSVECYSKTGCEARHAKSSIYSPTLCYVTSRSVVTE